ncbi:heme-dependent oxidative N-demethylase family protein [Ruegeria hyattellae]|uniref:heme-dependent oxidative N-demethylase family protein n=1 Tax=Ruegeria hyattellae TaxID=3233337 RepID=UPI00355C71AA
MTAILQRTIPYDPLTPRPLPGMAPLRMEDWLLRDEVFAAQMAQRATLLETRRNDVLAMDEAARPAAEELLDLVLSHAYPGAGPQVTRPDGVQVVIERADPMGTLGRLVQEDLCILLKQGDEHVLTGAVLCFPASWMLAEKYQRPLVVIHAPVAPYDEGIAKRVQRLFDGVQPERPLWRFNALWYVDPELHQPRSVHARRDAPEATAADYLRSERQCILRLPRTRAVVFSIHTYVLARADIALT